MINRKIKSNYTWEAEGSGQREKGQTRDFSVVSTLEMYYLLHKMKLNVITRK